MTIIIVFAAIRCIDTRYGQRTRAARALSSGLNESSHDNYAIDKIKRWPYLVGAIGHRFPLSSSHAISRAGKCAARVLPGNCTEPDDNHSPALRLESWIKKEKVFLVTISRSFPNVHRSSFTESTVGSCVVAAVRFPCRPGTGNKKRISRVCKKSI